MIIMGDEYVREFENYNIGREVRANKAEWDEISRKMILSEEFIEENSSRVNWWYISQHQKLSEELIDKYTDQISWYNVSQYQVLSENFIEKYTNKVYWELISASQILSEEFIEKHSDEVDWFYISQHQKLSEEFIEKYHDKVFWKNIPRYQKLSPGLLKKYNLTIPDTCWLYKDKEYKRKYIQENTTYEIVGDKVIAYKSCRSDGYSAFNFQYRYEVGEKYESHADHNINNESSFGLSAWTIEGALDYYSDGKLFKVEIDLDDIAAIVWKDSKIRARKIKIIEDIHDKWIF